MADSPIRIDPGEVDLGAYDVIVDVRPHAKKAARIPGSDAVRFEQLLATPADAIPERSSTVLVVCDVGMRSDMAAARLRADGYPNVVSLDGGIDAWRRQGLQLVGASGLTDDQLDRYDRHLKLASIGTTGQRALLDANVAVVGAGGLGSPVLAYLAGAGVGTITVIDDDTVDGSNLQRQPIHTTVSIGLAKVDSARSFVESLNPDVTVLTHRLRLDDTNAAELLEGASVVVDASDNFDARYTINDAAAKLGIPVVFASVYRMEGQVSVFDATNGPCYRCVFPKPPDGDVPLDCLTIGVLGAITGILGSIQATEAIKLIVGSGESLVGKLMLYDGTSQEFTTLPVARDPHCRLHRT
jgi:molybdopterin/thiamine biosynthesis adenylyltransferase/rhodanese-related sulfurtransferase